MKILKGIFRLLSKITAAVLGAVAAVWLFSAFMVIEVEGSVMLPELEPGQKIIVSRMDTQNLETGDLVVYKAPYYHIDGQGMYLVRRISGIRNDMVEVTADAQVPRAETEIIEKDIILGKVIRTWVKKNAN